jgi:hypothetical protein
MNVATAAASARLPVFPRRDMTELLPPPPVTRRRLPWERSCPVRDGTCGFTRRR